MSEKTPDEDGSGKESPYGTPPDLQFTLRGLVQFSLGVTVYLSLATTAARSESEWVSLGCGLSSAFTAWIGLLVTYSRLNARAASACHCRAAALMWLLALLVGTGSRIVTASNGIATLWVGLVLQVVWGAAVACMFACAYSLPFLVVTMLIAFFHRTRARR